MQMQFIGVPQQPNNPVNLAYPGPTFVTGAVRAHTGCGTDNQITTAGESKNSGASNPGTPTQMDDYRYGYSRTGGLVRDPVLNQASTRIHLINHRFDNSANTQGVASNIMLGSKNANNPSHLHAVENVVLTQLDAASQNNAAYESSLATAQRLPDADLGGQVTFWDNAHIPPNTVLPAAWHQNAWLDGNGHVTRSAPHAPAGTPKPRDGVCIKPPQNYYSQHLWTQYRVVAQYGGAPAFVQGNILHEQSSNDDPVHPGTPKNAALEARIQTFTHTWKDNAFPTAFTSNATYYVASWLPLTPYHRSDETPVTIPSDA